MQQKKYDYTSKQTKLKLSTPTKSMKPILRPKPATRLKSYTQIGGENSFCNKWLAIRIKKEPYKSLPYMIHPHKMALWNVECIHEPNKHGPYSFPLAYPIFYGRKP